MVLNTPCSYPVSQWHSVPVVAVGVVVCVVVILVVPGFVVGVVVSCPAVVVDSNVDIVVPVV